MEGMEAAIKELRCAESALAVASGEKEVDRAVWRLNMALSGVDLARHDAGAPERKKKSGLLKWLGGVV